ncbi:membrane fusion protein, cobalt-zinc-cadmium efflux system [Duganella sacchari]|uniref:Membrane fusion protein, cobalt-zinc-cadmium efflux system n=1 Tax=Duganella sacchari TaxID=551987 RepID=A0A1M7RB37_9BURK|nr:efflux RND transporter periplasmic adaptor subunit [Duganella sacchari]SHN43494.1 membrane fusion protein, cobalt-zinc-cadmium efflux system [Duganella sacchari]
MMEQQRGPLGWPLVAALVAVAAALGFGASHWLAARHAPVAAPASTSGATAAPAAATPAAASAADNGVEVKIPAEYIVIAKIAVETVGNGGLLAEILTAGTVAAPPNSEAVIVARAAGNVTRVKRQLGDTVRAGEALAQVDSLEAAAMAADHSVANAKAELARKSYARESSLFEQGVTPRQDMEAAQSSLAVAETEAHRASAVAKAAHVAADGKSVAVVSPINGRITAQMATLGGFVQPQTELFRVAGDGQVQVNASLPAADISRVAVGDKATIVASGGAPVEATVRSVTPTVSGSTRAATVVLTPVAPVRTLVVGEGVQARLHVKNGAAGLVVPEDAVQNVDGHDVLFVRTKDGFRVQPVLVGTRSGGVAQIVSGVSAGQQVATRNAFLVKADMIKSAKD